MYKNIYLWLEFVGIFIVIPLLVWQRVIDTPLIMIPVILVCIPATIWLVKKHGFTRKLFWLGDRDAEYTHIITIINRFLLISIVLFFIVFLAYPLHLFDMPRNMTRTWLLLLLIYPVISVYPQELLYRVFFFHRYKGLLKNPQILFVLNAVLFGWMHIVFHNLLAVIFSIVAGLLFADTYRKTQSMRLTCLEHTLYGYLIFTLGYGEAFLSEPWLRMLSS